MSLPDAAEARRISSQLKTLAQQRAQGNLPHEDAPLRLYRVRTGGFVRVLDRHPEPISPGMLEAIDAFIRKSGQKEDLDEAKPAPELQTEETKKTDNQEEPSEIAEQSRKTQSGGSLGGAGSDADVAVDDGSGLTGENVAAGEAAGDGAADVEMVSPWEAAGSTKTPKELLMLNERVSEWLSKDTIESVESRGERLQEDVRLQSDERAGAEIEGVLPAVDHLTLYEQWPPQLEERRKIWFMPQVSRRLSRNGTGTIRQPVIYWMRNTLRVTQGNYGLEAAVLLSRRLAAPLVVVCLLPSSIVYPVCHATTASDAYARYSYVELYEQFKHAGVPFFGITANEDGLVPPSNNQQTYGLKPNPLYELLDAFVPHVVVMDAAFDSSSRSDTLRLARYLELNRSSCPWSLLTMDSTTCCPAYQLSMKLHSTLEIGADFASEEQFGAEYTTFAQPRNGTYMFSPLPRVLEEDLAQKHRRAEALSVVLQRLSLEEINWQVVKAETSQSSSQTRRFSEAEGLQKLSQLLSDSSSQPAIQAELRGGGVLSLLPFIRHGTLSAGYVLRRISESIASCPVPKSPQERKGLAMRKVMRSRAANHFGKERDYALYLALWVSAKNEHFGENGPYHSDISLLSTSEMLSSLRSSVPRVSSLDVSRHLVPGWAFSSDRIDDNTGGQMSGAALYDPYELESARTKDLYWNDIQKSIVENQYLHPLLVVYWAYRVFTWSVSCRAAIATIESLLSQCVLGSKSSPDVAIIVWKHLFHLGMNSGNVSSVYNGKKVPELDELRKFQLQLEGELKSQPKLQLRS